MRTRLIQQAFIALFVALGAIVALSLGGSRQASADPVPCADLAVTAFSTSPVMPIAGQVANISITIQNNGTCSTNVSFVVQWKQTEFSPTGPSTTIGPLAPGASQVANLNYTFPFQGNFLSLVSIDTANAVAETNEVNNLAIRSVSVVAGTIDLSITDFQVAPNPNAQGQLTQASITVKNNGNTAAGQFQVAWQPTPFTPALTQNVAGLNPGASFVVGIPYNYPALGLHISTARVDSSFLIAETNEFNNTATTLVTIVPARPELSVTDISFNPPSPVAGQNVQVSVTIENTGFVPTPGNFTVQWKPSALGALQSQQVAPLGVGASSVVVFNYVYAIGGLFNTVATVDSTNVVLELNEFNNQLSEILVVQTPTRDLTITNVTIVPPPDQGEQSLITVAIQNNGNTAAGPFVVSWNPDAFGILIPSPGTLTQQVPTLAAGDTLNVVFQFTYPQAGPFHTIAQVDAFNVIFETNETNNLFIRDTVVDPDNINLDITAFTITPSNPDVFEEVTATITIQNTGSLPVSWFEVKWLLATTDINGPSTWVPGLNPGQSTTVTMTGLYFVSGSFTSRAIADPANFVPETNEGDNTFDRAITVNPFELP